MLSSESIKTLLPLKNQPPPDCNALIYVLSVHGQCEVWKGDDKSGPPVVDICVRGWEMKDRVTTPVVYTAPTAPPKLLHMVSCQCGYISTNPAELVDAAGFRCITYCTLDCVNMEKSRMKRRV